ncbi:hypothetical protein OE749_09370 [Aestuariibacter sp. AA17]|uniref:Alginate O-acetyltransferase AlgX n=1 Tax=Fluctibacter corallii TaxID=2984329 RepID=A0ABT3A8K2_9ALTE|nr:alginate biosynthesis protein AlgX [Aestuariibacter sp. AA17]MCV2884904.1 hypothetical protein [Aestuariibacter sp. AA17]
MRRLIPLLFPLAAVGTVSAETAPSYTIEATPLYCDAAKYEENYVTNFLRGNLFVEEGEQGWLVNTGKDLNSAYGFTEAAELKGLKRFASYLNNLGIELILVYTPNRGLAQPEMFTNLTREQHADMLSQYERAIEQFRQVGFHVPDLSHVAKGIPEFFYKRDLHWTPDGARATAKEIAKTLNELGYGDPEGTPKFKTLYTGVRGADSSIQSAANQLCNTQLPVQYKKSFRTIETNSGFDDSTSLFGDDESNIVLLGTSFTALEKFNFNGFLQEYSNISISNFAISGGAATGAWIDYLKSDFQENKPDVIVWELPSYYTLDNKEIFTEINPLFYNGCESTALLKQDNITFSEGGVAKEILFSKGLLQQPSKHMTLDIAFSNPAVRTVEATVWFGSGTHKTYRVKRNNRTKADGRFVFELGDHEINGKEAFLALDFDEIMLEDGSKLSGEQLNTTTATARLCEIPSSINNLVAQHVKTTQ